MVRYAMDFAQVQKRLLKEMAIPYALLDVDGKLSGVIMSFQICFREKVLVAHIQYY